MRALLVSLLGNFAQGITAFMILLSLVAHSSCAALKPRIIQGKEVSNDKYNFVAHISVSDEQFKLGTYVLGALISPDTLITLAGHTYIRRTKAEPSDLTVRFGAPDNFFDLKEQKFTIREIIRHPKFDEDIDNDIAVIKLDTAVPENIAIPVKIHTSKESTSMDVIVVGGNNRARDKEPEYPSKITEDVFSVDSVSACEDTFGKVSGFGFCTSSEGGKGLCFTDTGGPVLVESGDAGVSLLGLNSHMSILTDRTNPICGDTSSKFFHIRVAEYLDFIAESGNIDKDDIVVSKNDGGRLDDGNDDDSDYSDNSLTNNSDGDDSGANFIVYNYAAVYMFSTYIAILQNT